MLTMRKCAMTTQVYKIATTTVTQASSEYQEMLTTL